MLTTRLIAAGLHWCGTELVVAGILPARSQSATRHGPDKLPEQLVVAVLLTGDDVWSRLVHTDMVAVGVGA